MEAYFGWRGGESVTDNSNRSKPDRKNRRFVRYKEGAELYSMCKNKFALLAKEAKATYKVGGLVLVNLDLIDKHLELYRMD